jgi:histidinol-phosphate aminotransferase
MTPFPRDDYRALKRYDPDREPVAVDLSDNTNLWGTHPGALARIRAAGTDDLARYPELYADVLREAVAERFGVGADCVTTGAGSDDVLDSAFRAASGPGAVVSYASPTFSMVEPLARMNGMSARAVPWAEALADPARCSPAARARLRLPAQQPDRRGRAAGMVRGAAGARGPRAAPPAHPPGRHPRGGVRGPRSAPAATSSPAPLVILDEAYADFAEDTWITRGAQVPGLLVARTSSKAYGLAGLRCGFGVAAPETALEIEKSRGPYKVARLTAEAVAAAVRDEEGWMAGIVAEARPTGRGCTTRSRGGGWTPSRRRRTSSCSGHRAETPTPTWPVSGRTASASARSAGSPVWAKDSVSPSARGRSWSASSARSTPSWKPRHPPNPHHEDRPLRLRRR